MKTKQLLVDESQARSLYRTATPEFKQMLETTFGKEFFSQKITDRIKTYEDACRELGIDPIDFDEMKDAGFTTDEIYLREIKTITEALNEGWKPAWTNADQYKHYPWFRMSSGGFVFDDTYCAYSVARAGSASRLCFKSSELAEYAGKQFRLW